MVRIMDNVHFGERLDEPVGIYLPENFIDGCGVGSELETFGEQTESIDPLARCR